MLAMRSQLHGLAEGSLIMNTRVLLVALVTVLASTQALVAQQPEQRAPRDSAERGMKMMENMQQQMRVMDSMNARLDTLVQRMNRASGNAKVPAMAQVINELVSQRRAMQRHMHRMMHGRMMGGRDTAGADTSAHGGHRSGEP
jgi:predicted transcriptional regulator